MLNDKTSILVRDALDIWRAGTRAVDSAHLVQSQVRVDGTHLRLGPHLVALNSLRRIVVVGAGKAGAGMARGLVDALGPDLAQQKQLTGWINVPDDCVQDLPWIRLFGARPAGENLPTSRVIEGTRQIVELVRSCGADDLCLCLLSGGGSALLSLPREPVTLEEQVRLIDFLSAHRANIQELNTIRKQISQVKGGRLAAACRGPLYSLIISDVLGDPLDVIASGPTVSDAATPRDALDILRRFDPDQTRVAPSIYERLQGNLAEPRVVVDHSRVHNLVIGNLRVAIEAAVSRAQQLGYRTASHVPIGLEGLADDVGRSLAARWTTLDAEDGPVAWIEGGEPVVRLAERSVRGVGGRNQQVMLAMAEQLLRDVRTGRKRFCALSGGTDGEDGPTDAAGAWIDSTSLSAIGLQGLDPSHYLARNDAYHFFEQLGTLLCTGPTHTNVCDLRLILSA